MGLRDFEGALRDTRIGLKVEKECLAEHYSPCSILTEDVGFTTIEMASPCPGSLDGADDSSWHGDMHTDQVTKELEPSLDSSHFYPAYKKIIQWFIPGGNNGSNGNQLTATAVAAART